MLALVAGGIFAATPSRAAEDAGDEIPEIYLGNDAKFCVALVQLREDDVQRRKEKLLGYIDYSYVRTRWAYPYLLVGIDYAHFSYFHLVVAGRCEANQVLSKVLHETAEFFAQCYLEPEAACARIAIATTIDSGSGFVARSSDDWDVEPYIGRFRGRDARRACMIRIPLRDPPMADQFRFNAWSTFLSELEPLKKRYRLPFGSIRGEYYMYIEFYRQCEEKRALYDALLELMKRDHIDIRKHLPPPDFSPDVPWKQ